MPRQPLSHAHALVSAHTPFSEQSRSLVHAAVSRVRARESIIELDFTQVYGPYARAIKLRIKD